MKRNARRLMATVLGMAMAVSLIPADRTEAIESGKYSYFNDYTLGYDSKVVAYKNGQKTTLEDAGVKTYGAQDDNPFAPEVTQAWNTKDLVLTQPIKYTTEDGEVHDVESMLTNFDFIADPTAIDNSDVDGKLYVYGTTEGFSYTDGQLSQNEYANHSITILSTTDMVNWTDEGFMDNLNLNNDISNAKNKTKASGRWMDHAWAPSGLKIDADNDGKDEYYLFYTDAGSVVYVRGESPTGPWVDDLGKSICNTSLTNCKDVKWCFDPAVLVDDKGDAYVYFGGGVWDTESELAAHPGTSLASPKTGRVAKMKFDENGKVSIDGTPQVLDSYYMYEDSEVNMFNGKYYYSYCTNFYVPDGTDGSEADEWATPGSIAVYVSSDPMNISFNPATSASGDKYTEENGTYHHYLGTILDNPSTIYGRFYNNHHHMQSFKGHNYIFYHSTVLDNTLHRVSNDYRCLHVDEINVDSETDDITINPSYEGAGQIENFDPYKDFDGTAKKINATTTSYSAGVKSTRDDEIVVKFPDESPMVLDEIHTGDWTKIQGVDFGTGIKSVSASIKSETDEGAIEVWIDDPTTTGTKVASIPVSKNDEYTKVTVDDVTDIAGVHDVYFVFRGTDYTVASWEFTPEGTEVIPTKEPVPTREPVATTAPSAPIATSAPFVEGQDYKLVFNPDCIAVEAGKEYNINLDRSVTVSGSGTYAGIWFNLPKDSQQVYEKVVIEYKNGGGFGYACRYTDSSADEEISWGGKLSGNGTEEITFAQSKPLKGIKFFNDNNSVDIISMTFVPAKSAEPTPTPTIAPGQPTNAPTDEPSVQPTEAPTKTPDELPTDKPAVSAPTNVPAPTLAPTAAPQVTPSPKPAESVKKPVVKVTVKSSVKRRKSITAKVKITNPDTKCKVNWTLDAKGKKLVKLSKKSQKSVKITAGKKKGTATLIVKYGSVTVKKKIKIK